MVYCAESKNCAPHGTFQSVMLPIGLDDRKPTSIAIEGDAAAAVDCSDVDLDTVLIELGSMGRFQIMIFSLLLLPVMLFSMYEMSFLFTTGRLDYRYCIIMTNAKKRTNANQWYNAIFSCKIPECDSLESNVKLKPDWIADAVPIGSNGKPSQCLRYMPELTSSSKDSTCPGWSFNRSQTEQCGDFVYDTEEVTLVNEVCIQNGQWRVVRKSSIKHSLFLVYSLISHVQKMNGVYRLSDLWAMLPIFVWCHCTAFSPIGICNSFDGARSLLCTQSAILPYACIATPLMQCFTPLCCVKNCINGVISRLGIPKEFQSYYCKF